MSAVTNTLPSIEECELAFSKKNNLIGEGRDRLTYRIPGSKWVYKKPKHPAARVNEGEYKRYEKMLKTELPELIAIPEMHLLSNGVIAAEYISGKAPKHCDWNECSQWHTDCWAKWLERFEAITKYFDVSSSCNVRVVTDSYGEITKIYVIDLGE